VYVILSNPTHPGFPPSIPDKTCIGLKLQQLYLPELKMNWGQAVSALTKSWKAYRIVGRNGEPRSDLAYRIVSIQNAMGIEKSCFTELEGMEINDD